MEEKEIKGFVPMAGYEDRFLINPNGKIYSLKRKIFLKPHSLPSGYMAVCIMFQKPKRHTKTEYIHRLIASTFIERPEGKTQVNHKDGDKKNNSIENLEWVTQSENNFHATRVLGHKRNTFKIMELNKHKRRVPVDIVKGIREQPCLRDAYKYAFSKKVGVHWSTIKSIYNRETYKDIE